MPDKVFPEIQWSAITERRIQWGGKRRGSDGQSIPCSMYLDYWTIIINYALCFHSSHALISPLPPRAAQCSSPNELPSATIRWRLCMLSPTVVNPKWQHTATPLKVCFLLSKDTSYSVHQDSKLSPSPYPLPRMRVYRTSSFRRNGSSRVSRSESPSPGWGSNALRWETRIRCCMRIGLVCCWPPSKWWPSWSSAYLISPGWGVAHHGEYIYLYTPVSTLS